MKKTILYVVLVFSVFCSYAQQKGYGRVVYLDKNDSSSFEWTKYYDQKDSSFATTYLFSVKGWKWALLLVHTKGIERIEYTLKFQKPSNGELYVANDRSVDVSDFVTTANNTLGVKSDACNDCYDIELKFVSAKEESMKALYIRNMYNNIIIRLDK